MLSLREAIAQARRYLEDDPHLANYVVRDHPDLKRLSLSDLSWAIHREHGHRNDVEFLLDTAERRLAEEEAIGEKNDDTKTKAPE